MKTGTTKTKKTHSLNKPKRPMSAYNFFFKDERARIAAASGKVGKTSEDQKTFEDVGRIIGKRWRAVSEEQRHPYKELAAKDSARYKKEMKTFYADELALACSGRSSDDDDLPLPKVPVQQISYPLKAEQGSTDAPGQTGSPGYNVGVTEAAPSARAPGFAEDNKAPSDEVRLKSEYDLLLDLVQKQQFILNNTANPTYMYAQGSRSLLSPPVHDYRVGGAPSNVASYNQGVGPGLFQQQQLNNMISSNYACSTNQNALETLLLAQQRRNLAIQSFGQVPPLAHTRSDTKPSMLNGNDLLQLLHRHVQAGTLSLDENLIKSQALENAFQDQAARFKSIAPANDERKPASSSIPAQRMSATPNDVNLLQLLHRHNMQSNTTTSSATSDSLRLKSQLANLLSQQLENEREKQRLARELDLSIIKNKALENALTEQAAHFNLKPAASSPSQQIMSAADLIARDRILHKTRQESMIEAALGDASNATRPSNNTQNITLAALDQFLRQNQHPSNPDSNS